MNDELRDEMVDVIVDAWRSAPADARVLEMARRFADAVLAGPLRRLTAERDEARAANERVRAWVANMDDLAQEYRDAAAAVSDPQLMQQATNHAEDVQASADGVRRALDGGA